MKKALLASAAIAAMVATASAEGIREGAVTVSTTVGGYTFDPHQDMRTRPFFGLRAGYDVTRNFGVEFAGDYVHSQSTATGRDVHNFVYGMDLLYHFNPDGAVVPYAALGARGITLWSGGRDTHAAVDYGAGLKYYFAENVALRGDVRHLVQTGPSRYEESPLSNVEYNLGLIWQFGGKPAGNIVAAAPAAAPTPTPAAPPAPAPKPAPPVAAPAGDADGDGVPDAQDRCPNTPAGVAVDAAGCPADSDRDGVPDFQDQCPGTPEGVKVDEKGCPVDSDRDGVPDFRDKCPDTPAGVKVDASGCPVDADKDGVPDYKDQCPDTPEGVKVDEKGCPLDVDKDGVPDFRDRCPDSRPGAKVDADGCEVKPKISLSLQFGSNSAEIRPEYEQEIARVAEFMKKYPEVKVALGGHTDASGNPASNRVLSQKRADAVKDALVTKFGIDASRITAKGYGSTKPVADNTTPAGKAKNRRIEAEFTGL